MIKKIKVSQLKPGIFIHDFQADWFKHPFVFGKKKVNDWEMVRKIKSYGIKEVLIDTTKGLDVVTKTSVDDLKKAFGTDEVFIEKEAPIIKNTSLSEEINKAKIIKQEAKTIIENLSNDIRLGKQIELSGVDEVVENMMESVYRNQDALLNLINIRKKHEYTFMHSVNVSVIMIAMAKTMNLEQNLVRDFGTGALMHDIGKSMISDVLINMARKFSSTEYKAMQKHVTFSKEILESIPGISAEIIDTAYEHHERMDGSGYPRGIKGDETSLGGRLAAIIDVYDALTTERSYSAPVDPRDAIREIFNLKGSKFDEELIHQFIKTIGIYPIGSVVTLESGLVGVVIESGRDSILQPVVRVFYDKRKGIHIIPRDLDVAKSIGNAHAIKYSESPAKWKIPELGLI